MKHLHYGWFMVLISVSILATHALMFYSFGVFLRPITTEFHWERGALSAATSIMLLVAGPLGILSGRLSDKYGPRLLVTANGLLTGVGLLLLSQISSLWQVYLIFGLLLAVAASCLVVPITSTIPRWFAKREGMAIGLVWTGIGLGGAIAPLLAQWLIDSYGWRQAYIVLGLINLIIIIPLAQLMKRSPQQIGLKPYGYNETIEDEQLFTSTMKEHSFKQAVKTSHFWMFGFILFCFVFTMFVMITHIAPHIVDTGISATIAASIVSIFAAASLIGRTLSGVISDKIGSRLTLSVSLIVITLALIWLLFSREAWMFYLFAVLYGIAYGGIVPLQTILTRELFGLKSLGIIFAGLALFATLGGTVGAPLAGFIFDVTESYDLVFIISIILSVLAVTISLILLRSKSIGDQTITE
ncbi:MFS transporter [Chloroflexota bacterium]